MRLSVRFTPPSFNAPRTVFRPRRTAGWVWLDPLIQTLYLSWRLVVVATRKGGVVIEEGGPAGEPRWTGVTSEKVLAFWFGREGEEGYGEFREAWFTKDPDFDREVRDRFEDVYEEAVAGGLEGWKKEAKSCLALIVVLDQFPRNMYRGDPRMYAADGLALAAARHAVQQAYDRELPAIQRGFVYMPFMHSEDLEDQRLSVELFEGLAREPGTTDTTWYAVQHLRIVERFGRFPHRNDILGRHTTPEEAAFLKGPDSSF